MVRWCSSLVVYWCRLWWFVGVIRWWRRFCGWRIQNYHMTHNKCQLQWNYESNATWNPDQWKNRWILVFHSPKLNANNKVRFRTNADQNRWGFSLAQSAKRNLSFLWRMEMLSKLQNKAPFYWNPSRGVRFDLGVRKENVNFSGNLPSVFQQSEVCATKWLVQ